MTSKIRHLKDAIAKKKALDKEALLAGVEELKEEIEAGNVRGIAFAIEYTDGATGTHYFTTTEDPSKLHFAAATLQSRILHESVLMGLEDDEE